MRTLVRLLTIVLCAAIIFELVMLWSATGRRTFTYLPSPDIAELQREEGSLTGLFPEESAALPKLNNEFGFGLFPSDAGQRSASVLSIGVPAILVGLMAFIRGRRAA